MKTVSRIRNGSIKKSDGVIFRMAAATTDSSLDGFGASSSPAPLASAPSSRSRVLLPGPNRTYSDFAHEVGAILRDAIGDRIVPEKSADTRGTRPTRTNVFSAFALASLAAFENQPRPANLSPAFFLSRSTTSRP
jgi:hypothetical protein